MGGIGIGSSVALKAALKAALLSGSAASQLGHDPYLVHNFLVEVGGVVIGGFSEVGGLSSSIETEEYAEGGVNGFTHKFPTRTSASDITLSRGLVNVDFFWWWFEATSRGIVMPMNGTILMLNAKRLPIPAKRLPIPPMYWMFKMAYPIGWEGPGLNAGSDEVAVEKITLTHQGLTKFPSLSLGL
ncbi:phage tail protein [[Limnothrix rosea] IAM M-220]|uniref:phage tail protein n=1 Tax=[Limnothrix rosea] IAM M-220 TaxID=454133 RepID=UPI000967E0FA|nr:phage tail protein [[Limnothrix rosea] IAM M-220]OKH18100.1 phage tail protein [[Limnothrix rosea] IAM M-220]